MGRAKAIPKKDLRILMLDDDETESYRLGWFESFSEEFGQPKKGGILTTKKADQFIDRADDDRDALLFLDPGALGDVGCRGIEYRNDRILYNWLVENPSRTVNVIYTLDKKFYGDILTFSLDGQINDLSSVETEFFVKSMLKDWLYENNPLALFDKDTIGWTDMIEYVRKSGEPLVSAICEKLNVTGKNLTGRKKAVIGLLTNNWKLEMKRRGVKGYA